jgi:type II secretory pathway pseudopilin PulG
MKSKATAFTVVELLVAAAIIVVLCVVAVPAVWGAYKSSSLAVSSNNIRQLAAGGAAYLADNNYRFWAYRRKGEVGGTNGRVWWYGFEPSKSLVGTPEGQRTIAMDKGPLGPYVPRNIAPDPSFGFAGKPFKPKYKHGYIGIGYNVVLSSTNNSIRDGWYSDGSEPRRYWDLKHPERTVVFATAAQVNTFQKPASVRNPMIEEFYGFDDDRAKIPSVHFRHNGHAMVAYATGSAGLIKMDVATKDRRVPDANVGRLPPEVLR